MLSASSLLAGCGGHARHTQPRLPRSDAAQLIALAQTVARDARTDGCTARSEIDALSAKTRELVANGSVPLRLREPLLKGVGDLAAQAPPCTPPPSPPGQEGKHHKDHHGQGNGNGNGGGD